MNADPYASLATSFVRHYDTLRGALRYALVAEQLDEALASRPVEVVDVGGGAGHQAIRLARLGHEVTLLDPSLQMLDRARVAVAAESPAVRARLRLLEASAEQASAAVEGRRFGVVLCHGVLPYVGSPASVLHSLAQVAEPGAVLSLVYKNADALAMRPALEGRWSDAAEAFTAESDVGASASRRGLTAGPTSTRGRPKPASSHTPGTGSACCRTTCWKLRRTRSPRSYRPNRELHARTRTERWAG